MSNRLNVSEAACLLGVSASTLRRWRQRGIGPAFLKLGPRRIRYSRIDVDAFLKAARITLGPSA